MISDKREIGNFGEKIAEEYLRRKKYKIIEKNFQNKFGEIDLVAHHQGQLVFIEVKLKTNKSFGLPEEEFNFWKKKKLRRTINSYLLERKVKDENWRLDLIAIEARPEPPQIRHYKAVDFT